MSENGGNSKYFILQKSVKNPSRLIKNNEFENADIVFTILLG